MTSRVRAVRSDGVRSRRTILEAAAKLATVEGLDGLSIGRLADHIGMSKSGLFAHFGSKEELQLATIEMAVELFRDEVTAPAESVVEPLDRMETLCERFIGYLARRVFPGGCFFAAAAAEFDTHPGPVQDRIAETHDDWMHLLEELTAQAKADGSVAASEDPIQVAFEIDAYLLMANMAFVLHDDPTALDRGMNAIRDRIARLRAATA
jgi:AcrR family transcriptional regulator